MASQMDTHLFGNNTAVSRTPFSKFFCTTVGRNLSHYAPERSAEQRLDLKEVSWIKITFFLPFASMSAPMYITMGTMMAIIQHLGGRLCRLFSILFFQALNAISMCSPGQYVFALACGGIACALLSEQKKWANEAKKQRKERRKRVALPTQFGRGDNDKSSTDDPPVSASKIKFILTPKVETFPIEITRPVRSATHQQSSSSRSTTSTRVTKPIKIHKGISTSPPRPSDCKLGRAPKITTTTHAPKSRSAASTAGSPETVHVLTPASTERKIKSPPLQAVSGVCHEQPTETSHRRRSSNFQFSPEAAAQLKRLDPREVAPESVYNVICACLQRSGVTKPSTFYTHMAISFLKHEPDQGFYEYLIGKQVEEIQTCANSSLDVLLQDTPMRDVIRDDAFTENDDSPDASGTENCYTEMMSGAVNPADAHLLDPRTRRRPRYIVPENHSVVCDKGLPLKEQFRLQPSHLLGKDYLWENFSSLFFEPESCFRELDDDYYTTHLGLEMILRLRQAIREKAQARLILTSDEQDRVNIMRDADRPTLVWLYRLGGYFDLSPETCYERGNVRYPEDLIPFSEPPADRKRTDPDRYFWDQMRRGAMRFWGKVGFEGEYDEQGYIPGNDSEGYKWWQAHSRWEKDRARCRAPRPVNIV